MFDEYPRPQMVRGSWLNLCGPWDYAVTRSATVPAQWQGKIRVPFPPEAPASGVGRTLQPGEYLWYHRTEDRLPEAPRVLLHFGAADQRAVVWVNGVEVGSHIGGYTPFDIDITDALGGGRTAEIVVCVQDDTERSQLCRGRQRLRRGGVWYTAQSGLWMPVWAEGVPEEYIRSLKITPLYDESAVLIEAVPGGTVHFGEDEYESPARVPVPGFVPWSPENPRLYDFTVTLGQDTVSSYFAMRKFSVEDGQLCLNGRTYFHNGVLDGGMNPEGLYTCPSDEQMQNDILTAKAMGFNTIRKYQKVEPLRWYYHCDRIGMLVWQDIPAGGGKQSPLMYALPDLTGHTIPDSRYRIFGRADRLGREQFETELHEVIAALYNCPSIAMWTIFDEGHGQFDAARLAALARDIDPTRTVDHAGGRYDQGAGSVKSVHRLFRHYRYRPDPHGRAVVLSFCGGYNCRVSRHMWDERRYGNDGFSGEADLLEKLRLLYTQDILPAKKAGLSAAVYCRLTDIEDEINGLITYDRQVVKASPEKIRAVTEGRGAM